MVHRREVTDNGAEAGADESADESADEGESEVLVFGIHGALLGNAMTWWDHDTGSIWSQPTGEAVAGPRKGQTLELLPMSFTTWGSWFEANPGTQALLAPAARTGFDLEELLIVVDFTTDVAAYRATDVQDRAVINDVVAGLEIAVVADPLDPSPVSYTHLTLPTICSV